MPENGNSELTPDEQAVLGVVRESRVPLDAISVASQTRLGVDTAVQVLEGLAARGLLKKSTPEPVHERFASVA